MAPHDIVNAISKPHDYISKLFDANEGKVDDAFEVQVASSFRELLKGHEEQVPSLHALHRDAPVGSLVRFRCMVQDTVGDDVYSATSADGKRCTIWSEPTASDVGDTSDFTMFRQRQMLYCTEVPSETAWSKESWYPGRDLTATMSNLDISDESPAAKAHTTALEKKFALPRTPHLAALVKMSSAEEPPKPTEIIEVVGVYEQTAWSPTSSIDPEEEEASPAATVPCIYTLYWQSASSAPASSDSEAAFSAKDRAIMLAYIGASLGGDIEAAEWVLLHLLSRVYSRRASLPLGNFPLNISLAANDQTTLDATLSSLLPLYRRLDLSLETLNSPQDPFYAPRSVDENLEAGQLQLPSSTHLLIDETSLNEGKLNDKAVRNVQALSSIITEQSLHYVFPFSSFGFPTDLPVLVLSRGKTMLPVPCVVAVRSVQGYLAPSAPDATQLSSWRSAIQRFKAAEFSIPEAMIKRIESDFVKARQTSPDFTQEDLSLRMTAARLMALSMGKTALDEEAWERTTDLDERRRAALAPSGMKV